MSAHGLIVVDKPGGMTSHDVVARARRVLGTRKVGHAGTLDPMATGVLILGVGRATRLLGYLSGKEKSYTATVRLGMSTTTDDAEGEVTATRPADHVTGADVRQALQAFRGEIDQVPSMVSAIRVGGRRSYEVVREGQAPELAARRVVIHDLTSGPPTLDGGYLDVPLAVSCSSGTYVRAIARDLGAALGVGGHLTALRRTSVAGFDLAEATADLDRLPVMPIEVAARRSFPGIDLSPEQAAAVSVGRALPLRLPQRQEHAVFAPDGQFLALYVADPQQPEWARAARVFVG